MVEDERNDDDQGNDMGADRPPVQRVRRPCAAVRERWRPDWRRQPYMEVCRLRQGGGSAGQTVTVIAKTMKSALQKARSTMDRRYERAGKEPPVGWTFSLVSQTPHRKMDKQTFVVLVKTGELEIGAYGPYSDFSAAEGDAKAWDGFVLPVDPPSRKWSK